MCGSGGEEMWGWWLCAYMREGREETGGEMWVCVYAHVCVCFCLLCVCVCVRACISAQQPPQVPHPHRPVFSHCTRLCAASDRSRVSLCSFVADFSMLR